jgi:hypothetical protein
MPNYQVQTYIINPFFDQFLNSSDLIVDNLSLNLFVYDLNDVLVQYIEDIPNNRWSIDENILYHDLYDTLYENNIYSGNYRIKYSIFNNIFGNPEKKLYIKDISEKRLEFRIVPTSLFTEQEITHFSALSKKDVYNHFFTFYLKTDNNELLQVVNFLSETRIDKDPKYSFIVKLDTPALESILLNDKIFIVLALNQEELFDINIIPTNVEKTATVLKSADFSIKVNKKSNESMGYKTWTDLISQNDTISSKLIGKYLSSGSFGIDLNIDFRTFENFIHFSSAEKRLDSFKYKLTSIEDLDESISNLYTAILPVSSSITGSGEFVNNILKFKSKKNEIIQSFDFYENYLYYSTSSYESSSFGEFDSMSWPKTKSGSYYIPLSVTSSAAENWYTGISYSASLYDRQNDDALIRYVPEFIVENELNSNYNTFVYAVGHLFDNIWVYINSQENLYKQDESLYYGIAKDLIYNQLKSFGWDSINDNQFDDLWYYSIGVDSLGGTNVTGSFTVNEQMITATSDTIPYGDISKEFWKRILNNLPHLFKSKGTKEGIRSLINCYGVPSTILRIKEYGGPEKVSAKSYYQYDKFTYAIDFNQDSGSYIGVVKGPLIYTDRTPNTIEFRFRTINSDAYTTTGIPNSLKNQILLKREDDGILITLTNTLGQYGTVDIYMSGSLTSSTPSGPFFNGEWWSYMLRHNETNEVLANTHTFDMFVKQAKWFDISHEYSSSFTLYGSGSDSNKLNLWFEEFMWNFGSVPQSDNYYPFNGQFQEFRYWGNALTEDQFDNHVMAPSSVYSSQSFDNLGLRFPLGTDLKKIDTIVSQSIYSQHLNWEITEFTDNDGELTGSFKFNGSPIEIPFIPIIDYYSLEYPDLSSNRFISNKVRIESNFLTGQLDIDQSHEQSEFDTYPIDSNKFGVYFSPTDEINEDIAEQYGGFKIDDYIGGWNNYFSSSYSELNVVNREYIKKFTGPFNVKDYLRIAEFYNNSLFAHIRDNTPIRSKKLLGVVIEPHILNRSKIAFASSEPIFTQLEKAGSVDYIFGNMSGSYYKMLTITNDGNDNLSTDSIYTTSGDSMEMLNNLSWTDINFGSNVEEDYNHTTIMTQRPSSTKVAYSRSSGSYGSSGSYSTGSIISDQAQVQDFISNGLYDSFYAGTKISSTSINSPTLSTPDGKAVVEVFVSSTGTLISKESEDGLLIVQ